MNAPKGEIEVQVVYAEAARQHRVHLTVPAGTTAAQAVAMSAIAAGVGDPGLDDAPLGVYGHRVDPTFELADGDRVEIYRPLQADPKVSRRTRALAGRTMSQ
ncbi:MAG: RnfH family protein [Pseudomonadota bacterium]